MSGPARFGSPSQSGATPARRESANLADILERVLDRGVVIAGDIRVNLLDIELLTIKLRLVIASVDTARELGIDWWEHDPWLSSKNRDLIEENRRLRHRLAAVEEDEEPRSIRERETGARSRSVRAREADEEGGGRRLSAGERDD